MKTKISARKFLSKYMIYLAFVALLIVFSLTLRNVGNGFLDMGNVWNIIRQTALIAILGVGMTYALGAGQIDLSVGSVVGLTSLVTAWTVQAAGLIPGVLAGLVPCPVLAVPTSVGYGVGAGGMAALHSMLCSCVPGLAVLNIDNGFGAAAFAAKLLRHA